MKKLFLLIALMFCLNVYAKPVYTDYQFIGYVDERIKDDEFYKYEEVSFNKFYKMIRTDEEYLKVDDVHAQEHVDKGDFIIKKVNSLEKSNSNSDVGMITIRAFHDTLAKEIRLANFSSLEKIDKIEIYNKDKIYSTIDGDSIYIKFVETLKEPLPFKDISFIFYYDLEESLNLTIDIENYDGYSKIFTLVTLNSNVKMTKVNILVTEDYNDFLKKNSFPTGETKIHYFQYDEKYFKYYNLKKEYFKESDKKFIEGYTYDPSESIVKYKVYKRELLENEPDDVPEFPEDTGNNDPSNSNTDNSVNNSTDSEESSNNSNDSNILDNELNENFTNNKGKEENINLKPIKPLKKENETESLENDDIVQENESGEDGESTRLYDTVDNLSITNLNNLKDNKNDNICSTKFNGWIFIGISLIILAFVLIIIHYFNVKYSKE